MPYDKLVDSSFLDNGLKQIADSIRAKTGTEDELVFPTGMSEAIDGISGGDTESYALTDFTYFCYRGTRVNDLDKINTSKGTIFKLMFSDASSLKSIPKFDTSNGTDFSNMFKYCYNLQSIPELNTDNATSVVAMFAGCNKLQSVPKINISKCDSLNSTFNGCKAFTSIHELDTAHITNFYNAFRDCTNLTTISNLDLNKATDLNYMFQSCTNLTNLYIYNIRKTIGIGSGTSWGHLLTVDSLVHTIKELCTVTSIQRLAMGAANLEKIADLYCKVIDDTTEKIEMELCESTDEDAMTLSEYASLKNWTFA